MQSFGVPSLPWSHRAARPFTPGSTSWSTPLAEAHGRLSRAPTPQVLAQQIVAQLASVIDQRSKRLAARGTPGKKTIAG